MGEIREFLGNRAAVGIVAALLLLFAVSMFFYNRTLSDLAAGSCSDEAGACPHEKIVETQNIVIAALLLVLAIVAGYLAYFAYSKPSAFALSQQAGNEAAAISQRARKRKIQATDLDADESRAVAIINEAGGTAFQSDIIRKTGFSKVKVSRVLDRLEQKGLLERKRRGMTNLVVAK
jgi:DNA-binding MarR family transcriptional regulator